MIGAAVTTLAAVNAVGTRAAAPTGPAPRCEFFDDFAYTSFDDPLLSAHGWEVRTRGGAPGVTDVQWLRDAIAFRDDDGVTAMRLFAHSDGTGRGTVQSEVGTTANRFLRGTYAAMIHFTDQPLRGAAMHVNQTFFAINTQTGEGDPTYSELDLAEYLPNGGWGNTGPLSLVTSYHTYWTTPEWSAQRSQSSWPHSLDGWHIVAATVDGERVRYFVDDELVAEHSRVDGLDVTPRRPMSIRFNIWFLDLQGHPGNQLVSYLYDVDWVYHAADETLGQADVLARVDALRAGSTFADTMPSCRPQPGS